MLVKTIDTAGEFRDEFVRMGRENQFSYEGLEALFNYYDEVEETIELDVIAICCEFSEYRSFDEYLEDYPDAAIDEDWMTADKETILDYLNQKRYVIDIPGTDGFIVEV